MPRLCVDKLDVLLLDHTGKNISGTGMDTNIVGRVLNPSWDGFSEPTTPVIKAIGIHRLAEPSHGNGGGIRARSHCHYRNRGTEYVSESGMKWVSGGTTR